MIKECFCFSGGATNAEPLQGVRVFPFFLNNVFQLFIKYFFLKLKNVSCEYDRVNG